jgi:hypothetical protein
LRRLQDSSIFTKYFKDRFFSQGNDWDRDSSTVKLSGEIIADDATEKLAKCYMLLKASTAARVAAWTSELDAVRKQGWNISDKLFWLER